MSARARIALTTAISACAALLVTGCSSTSITALRFNPTPELARVSKTSDEVMNEHALTANMNIRSIGDDLDRLLLLSHPSRLSPEPIPR
ncbi:MAG: hypothetical protein H6810_05475 [Phycisphaeraceae bacterium]|nr:MAG: hypothetical protein H6810_05475 [Phycisphaeraceae bacterium]